MKVLTAPQPQAFKTPYLRNRSRVTPDTPDYAFLCWGDKRRPSDIDRLIYRDSRGMLCAITHAAAIEFSGRGTLVLLAAIDGHAQPAYRSEARRSLEGHGEAQYATVRRAGDAGTEAEVKRLTEALKPGHALLLEEKQETEHLSEGERRLLAGLNSGQRQEVWTVHCLRDGSPYGVSRGMVALGPAEFRRYVEEFGGFTS